MWVATAIVGSAAVGAAATAYSANKAAESQTNAANNAIAAQTAAGDKAAAAYTTASDKASGIYKTAADQSIAMQQGQYQQNRADLSPYRDAGVNANNQLQAQLPFLTAPIVMDQAALEKTPGYQFNLTQGLKAVQNSAAARGLGTSGAALKGASTFATGLADSTYQNQFNNANTNNTNTYNRLKGLVDTGETAAAQTSAFGTQAALTSGQSALAGATGQGNALMSAASGTGAAYTGVGNAQAQGYTNIGNAQATASNATGGAISGFANNVAGYAAYKGLYGNTSSNNGYDPSGGGSPANWASGQ